MSKPNQYILFLKGLCALLVFGLHFTFAFIPHYQSLLPFYMFTPAWTAVWIFFIISGYLTGKSFWIGKYKADNIKDFYKFYFNRIIHIFPVYFFIVIIDLIFINTNMYFNGSQTLIRVFTFTLRNPYTNDMIGTLWYVATLVQLYLLAPFVWKFLIKHIQKLKHIKEINTIIILFVIIGGFLLRSYLYKIVSWDYFILPNVTTNLDLFFCSFLFSYFTKNMEDTKLKKYLRPIIISTILVFIFINTHLMYDGLIYKSYIIMKFVKIKVPTIILILILLSLYAFDVKNYYYEIFVGQNFKEKFINMIKRPLLIFNYLGIVSFGFYCCHCQIINKVFSVVNFNNNKTNFIFSLFFSLLFTLIWAIIVYIFIEKKTLRFKK